MSTMIFERLLTLSRPPGSQKRPAVRFLLLSLGIAFLFALPAPSTWADDAAGARKKLDDEYIPFTPEKYLHYVFMNDAETVGLFLEGGMAVDAVDPQGRSALHIAAGLGDGEILDLLLAHGADPNLRDNNGSTPLCEASEDGHLDNVQVLLRARADIGPACGVDKNSPLHLAAAGGHGSVARTLIGSEAPLEAKNRLANTPLHAAIRSENRATLQLLIEAGANPAARNERGETPLHQAVTRGKADMVKALLAAGAPLEARNARGATPLWLAANYDALEIARLLLDAGADPGAKATDGDTPLQIAERVRSARVLELLRNVSRSTRPQSTPSLPKAP
jgi:ankyrin repeat protein